MPLWLLDTNIASLAIKGDAAVLRHLAAVPMHQVKLSVVTQAELLYGVAKRAYPSGLTLRVREFLARAEALAWTPPVAQAYADLRASCEAGGVPLAPLDMMIAAHAMALSQLEQTVLVSRDRAFSRVPGHALTVDEWR